MPSLFFRRATKAVATANNVLLGAGEAGVETDTQTIKVGNGTDRWTALRPHYSFPSATDGQLYAYSAAADGLVAVNASGAAELASAIVNNGATDLNTQDYGGQTYAPIAGQSITVPPSGGRPVTLEWWGLFQQNVAGPGSAWLSPFENGAATYISIHRLPVGPGDLLNGSTQYATYRGACEIGVVTSARTFVLSGMVYRSTATDWPAVAVLATSNAPVVFRAMAG